MSHGRTQADFHGLEIDQLASCPRHSSLGSHRRDAWRSRIFSSRSTVIPIRRRCRRSRMRFRSPPRSARTSPHFHARPSVQLPGHFISAALVSGVIAGEAGKSRKNAQELLAAFDAAAAKAGILHETILEKCLTLEVPDILVEYARLRDLTILPMPASLRSMVRRSDHLRIGQADPDPAGEAEAPAVPARDRRGRLGFQPRRRARGIRRHADPRTGEEGSHRDRRQREGAGHQAVRRGTGQESGPARHRCRAGQGRRQGPIRSARSSNPTRRRRGRTAGDGRVWAFEAGGSSCWAARPAACCRSRRCRSCSRIKMAADPRPGARCRCGAGWGCRCWCCTAPASRSAPASTS